MVKPLWRMLKDAIHHIIEYTAAGKEGFFADRKTQDLKASARGPKRMSSSLNDVRR
jgi:hypothetical protein